MEYIEGFVPLTNVIPLFNNFLTNMITQNAFKIIVSNICDAIDYMHSMHIAHSDLKPDNILVNPATGDIKIIDYGLSCLDQDCKVGFGFTLYYLDPELFKIFNGHYDKSKKNKHKLNFQSKEYLINNIFIDILKLIA